MLIIPQCCVAKQRHARLMGEFGAKYTNPQTNEGTVSYD